MTEVSQPAAAARPVTPDPQQGPLLSNPDLVDGGPMAEQRREPEAVSKGLPTAFAELCAEAGPLRRAAFDAIRIQHPLPARELAELSGLSPAVVAGLLERLDQAGLVRQDDQQRVVGIAGLSLEPTAHRLRLDGTELFTWCAIDAVGIPAALRVDAQVVTRCWHCGTSIQLELACGAPSAASAQMVWLPQADCTNVFDQFCAHANMFCGTAHLRAWQEASKLLGRALDLAGAAALGRDSWAEFARTDPSL
jgi:hypothetical protein